MPNAICRSWSLSALYEGGHGAAGVHKDGICLPCFSSETSSTEVPGELTDGTKVGDRSIPMGLGTNRIARRRGNEALPGLPTH